MLCPALPCCAVLCSAVQIMDKDRFLADDFVGKATLDLQQVSVRI